MSKKDMTPAEREAWGEKMRLAREAKARQRVEEVKGRSTKPQHINRAGEDLKPIVSADVQELRETLEQQQKLIDQLLEGRLLESAIPKTPKRADAPEVSAQGTLVGAFERYITDPAYYPDPTEALANEPRLKRVAFSDNFELDYLVEISAYTNIDNVRVREPKFTLKLVRIMLDEDTGEPTDGRFVATIGVWHEDPEAALEIAKRNNIAVDTENEKAFLDAMRYLRMREWLFEAFWPAPQDKKAEKRQTVIGNKLVEVYTKSNPVGEATDPIPFAGMKKL